MFKALNIVNLVFQKRKILALNFFLKDSIEKISGTYIWFETNQ